MQISVHHKLGGSWTRLSYDVITGRANSDARTSRSAAASFDDVEVWYGDRESLITHNFIQRGENPFARRLP